MVRDEIVMHQASIYQTIPFLDKLVTPLISPYLKVMLTSDIDGKR